MILDSERCISNLRCSVNVCPLYSDLVHLNHIPEDGFCHYILDYLEGTETPFDEEIRATEKLWKEKIGEGNLERRLAKRNVSKDYWQKRNEIERTVVIPSEFEHTD
jgi:hypothetical protein